MILIRINLLGLPKAKRRAPVVTMEGGRAMIFLVVLLVAVGALQYWRYNGLLAEGERLDQEVQKLEAEKVRLAGIRSQHEIFTQRNELLTRRISIIEELKARQSGPVQLLNTIAATVSNTGALWLVGFEQTGQTVTIQGIALNVEAVADFLTNLQNSEMFSEVEMQETYQDNTVTEIKNFNFILNGQLAAPSPATAAPGPAT